MPLRALTVAGLPLVLFALGATAAAQFRSQTSLIEAGAMVLDRDGEEVRGLVQSDFEVLEDGRPSPIQTFAEVDADEPATPDDGRFVALLVESRSSTARKVARQLIDRMGARDVVAILGVNGSHATTTDDPELARKQLDDLATVAHVPSVLLHSTPSADAILPRDTCSECGTSGNSVGPLLGYSGMTTGDGRVPSSLSPSPRAAQHYTNVLLDQMADLANQLKRVPHRHKALIYIGNASSLNMTTENTRSGDSGRWFDVIRNASRADAAIDVIGVGLPTGASYAGARMLAEETGGETVLDTNYVDAGLERVWQRTGHYYLIGYSPASEKKKRHKVEIRVTRPGLDVHALKTRG
ncbi:MAG TPA: VWA domain-containing protein [Vicinamibacterales bacterium]